MLTRFEGINMLKVPRSIMLRYVIAVLAVALALLLTLLLWTVIQPQSSLLFLAAVMFSAWYGGLGPGVLSTVLSTLMSVYFFEPPAYGLSITLVDILRSSIFVLVGLLISSLNGIRQRTEETLCKREEQIRLIADSVPILLSYIDSEQRYRFNNQTYEQWFGYSRQEFIGKHLKDVLDRSAYQELQGYFEAVLSGQEVTYETAVSYPDTRQRYIRATYVPHFGEQQQVKGFVALVDDITERKQAEEALKKERDFSNTILSTVGSLVVVLDRQGRIVRFNKACEKTTGYSFDEVNGKTVWDLFLIPEEVESVRAVFEQLLITELPSEYENYWLTKDGRRRLIAWSNTMLVDNEGSIEYVISTGIDITERQQAEEILQQFASELERRVETRTAELKNANAALAQEITERQQVEAALYDREQQLRALVNNTPDVIIRCDKQLRYVYVNPAVERNTGSPTTEFIGKTSEELGIPPHLCQLWNETLLKVFETGTEQIIEYQAPSVLGLRTYQSRVVPELDKDGLTEYALVVARDITEIKQAEEERATLIREQEARTQAEAAQRRSAFLAEASTVLASSLDYETTLKSVVHLAVPYLADWCSVDLVTEDEKISRVEVAHLDPAKVEMVKELLHRYPPEKNPQSPIMSVVRRGRSVLVAKVPDSLLLAVAQDEEYLKILRKLNPKSYIIVPLRVGGRTLGVLSFAMAESGRYYTSEDLALAEELGYRASIAIDNALLYHASEAARKAAQQAKAVAEKAADRTARLQAVTAALSKSLTPSQVAEVIAEQGVMALGATSALIALLTEDGTELEVVRALDIDQALSDAWHRFSINASVPLAQAVRTGKPLWPEPTAARIARYPHLAREYNQVNYGAWISIPLMLEGRAVGGMSFSFTQTTDFSEDDQAFTLTLAQQCAQALERARLYALSEEARRTAETANRTKDEFLATLSHELRTPLNAMLGWTQLLRTRKLDEATTVRAIETIDRNTKSLATLIEDVLDVSRIITGKLRLDVRPIELVPVIEAAIDAVRSAAEAKGIRIEYQLDALVGIVLADPDRLQQVAWNLLSNAIKFTPQGGKVEVQLEIVDRLAGWQVDGSNQPANLQPSTHAQPFNPCVQLRVSDTGKGISPDFLPYVFERFSQADSTTTRAYGGLGLGLAIVRHLVDMHGGTVRAESSGEGQGATFIVNLPLRRVPSETTSPKLAASSAESKELFDNSRILDGLRLLIVDDEADVRELLRALLTHYGAEVTAVVSAREALEAVERLNPDMLISDIGMPVEDGYALIRKLRTQEASGSRKLPAIALTAYAREEDSILALEAGFQKHLPKPVESAELVKIIAQMANR
jgi:PAS domain S-box-containing protein